VVRFAGPAWLRWPVGAVVEFLRGTSCFVQLFWCFYALPMLGVTLTPFVTSVIVLGLNSGSFGSEVVRGALEAVPRGQTEAARALSYSPFRIFVHMLAPQARASRSGRPRTCFVDLLKLTPLTSLVTVSDLTRNAMIMRTQTGSTLVTLLVIFAVYFVLASLIYAAMNRLEARLVHRRAARADAPGARWRHDLEQRFRPVDPAASPQGLPAHAEGDGGRHGPGADLGLVLALCAYAPQRALRAVAPWVTELLRRTPLLVHIYILFFALPELGIVLSPLTAGILALGLHTGSYMSAVYQSGINAVPAGQWEAARSLGYSRATSGRGSCCRRRCR
jgi:polar amino acid transport system permease protein